jgi:hypothetical protein
MNPDLFGQDDADPSPAGPASGPKKSKNLPKGYAARPGSGPAGETCRTCDHAAQTNIRFWKCHVIHHRWTRGPGTDIRLKSPACSFWTKKP